MVGPLAGTLIYGLEPRLPYLLAALLATKSFALVFPGLAAMLIDGSGLRCLGLRE